jgi:RNA polymerase sigma-70 factor (ECF subfamily)
MSLGHGRAGSADPTPDASYVERARRGDAKAFEALVRRHFRTAYVIALSLLSNGMDAEDVVQDAFLKALERLDDCRDPSRFGSWLRQIVRNRAHNFREHRRVRAAASLDLVTAASTADSAEGAERGELRARLEQALSRLSEIQRQVVLWHDLEGLKHREIAERLEISEGMSRQHLFSARRALRQDLGGDALKEHFHE